MTFAEVAAVSGPPISELEPLGESIKKLRAARTHDNGRRWSQEDVAFAVRDLDPEAKLTAGSVSQVETSKYRPTIRVMEALAKVFGVDPEIWVDYRLALARLSMDEREVGPDRALANLKTYESTGPSPAEIRKARVDAMKFAEADAERVARKRRRKS